MDDLKLSVGIVASSKEACRTLRSHTIKTGLASVKAELISHQVHDGDPGVSRIVRAKPDVTLVDLKDGSKAVASLAVLSDLLPTTKLVFCCPTDEPRLLLEGMRAGARELLPKPCSADSVRESLSRFVPHIPREDQKAGKTYAVLSAKGASGATSVAINLAFGFAQLPDRRVSLIDLALPVGDLATHLNLTHEHSVQKMIQQMDRLDETLLETFMASCWGVSVLPGLREPQPHPAFSQDFLEWLFPTISHSYTHSVLDLSSALSQEMLRNVSELASKVFLVLTPEIHAVWRASSLVREIVSHGEGEKLHLILNRSHNDDSIREPEIEKVVQHPVFWSLPNNYRAASAAIDAGRPMVSLSNNGVSQSYRELVHKLEDIPAVKRRMAITAMFSF